MVFQISPHKFADLVTTLIKITLHKTITQSFIIRLKIFVTFNIVLEQNNH